MSDSMERQNTRFEVDGAVAVLTIARPKALNALNAETLAEIGAAIDAVEADASIRGLIVTGDGPKAFVAGADISRMPEMDPADAESFSKLGSGIFRRLELLDIPVLAAVNGFALGGGCELAMACDFIYCSENARFGQPEVNLGIIAGYGGTQRLPRRIGYGPAIELLMNGEMIDAAEALRIGLVNRVVPADELMETARKGLGKILKKGPVAVAMTKAAISEGVHLPLDEGLAVESQYFGKVFGTSDAKEGVSAFIEKRKPDFKGE